MKNNKSDLYRDWSIEQRISRVLKDEEFREHCRHLRQSSDFDNIFVMVEKIARIDTSKIKIDEKLIHGVNLFSKEEVIADTFEFYQMIDKLAPNGINLTERINQNKKYLTTKVEGRESDRSSCCARKKPDGSEFKEIFINIEGNVGDSKVSIHEFAHSCSDSFTKNKPSKDKRMAEMPTVIMDHISARFLKEKYPHLCENFIEDDIFGQRLNVKKARECLMEALIVKVMVGEVSLDEVVKKYGYLYESEHRDILPMLLKKIENHKFNELFKEAQYLIPQAVGLEMRKRYKKEPELVARQIKEIIEHENDWTEEQALEYLGFPQREQLINDYIDNFQTTISQLQTERQLLKEKQQALIK